MRRSLRPILSAALSAAFFVQSTGAADLAPVFARGMMLPPPAGIARLPMPAGLKLAPPPKKAQPAGEPWFKSAAIVGAWIWEHMTAPEAAPVEALPTPEALSAMTEAATTEATVMASVPSPEPPADRMMIAMEGRRVVASGLAAQLASILQYRSELKPLRERFVGEWVGSGQARARVDYMNPFGVTTGEAKGFRVRLADGYERLLPYRGAIPNSLMRELPLYFAGDSVDMEITVLNTGTTPLTELSVVSVQEDHTASGQAGAPISTPVIKNIAAVAPGRTAVLRWRIKLSTVAREAVNFEQTHLRVLSKQPDGSEKVLLDQAQAGIIDPPGDGLR